MNEELTRRGFALNPQGGVLKARHCCHIMPIHSSFTGTCILLYPYNVFTMSG